MPSDIDPRFAAAHYQDGRDLRHDDVQASQAGSGPFTLEQMVAFLCGEAPLDGVWFGEQHPGQRSPFWWRKFLRRAVTPGVRVDSTDQGEKA